MPETPKDDDFSIEPTPVPGFAPEDNQKASQAVYLSELFASKQGYETPTQPEVEPLKSACDILLTYADGYNFKIICICDRDTRPGSRFGLSADSLVEITKRCVKYANNYDDDGRHAPVMVHIVEVGKGATSPENRERLTSLRTGFTSRYQNMVILSSWALDSATGEVWTNEFWWDFSKGIFRKFLVRSMASQRESTDDLFQPPVLPQNPGPPLLTYGLLSFLLLIYLGELAASFHLNVSVFSWIDALLNLISPPDRVLVALGAMVHEQGLAGAERYRLITSLFLHQNLIHLLFNGSALYFAGHILERLIGKGWYFLIFLVAGISGNILSLALNPHHLLSLGASGAIMGLLGATFVVSQHLPAHTRAKIQERMLVVILPALFPHNHQHIDVAAHLGGLLGGVLVGLIIIFSWSQKQEKSSLTGAAWVFALAGLGMVFYSFSFPLGRYNQLSEWKESMIPESEIPRDLGTQYAESARLVQEYPHDPRTHEYRANTYARANNTPRAVKEIRLALAETDRMEAFFTKSYEVRLRVWLGQLLIFEKKRQEALEAVKPVCGEKMDKELAEIVKKCRLCDPPPK